MNPLWVYFHSSPFDSRGNRGSEYSVNTLQVVKFDGGRIQPVNLVLGIMLRCRQKARDEGQVVECLCHMY